MIATRADVVREARSWLGTRFMHGARVKGAGVDCAQLVAAVYEATGVIPPIVFPDRYSPDWFLHHADDVLSAGIQAHTRPVTVAEPGDVAAFQFGRAISHAAIVIAWPIILHADAQVGSVILDDAVANARLSRRLVGCYSPFLGSA